MPIRERHFDPLNSRDASGTIQPFSCGGRAQIEGAFPRTRDTLGQFRQPVAWHHFCL
jgi:hypothetical protein